MALAGTIGPIRRASVGTACRRSYFASGVSSLTFTWTIGKIRFTAVRSADRSPVSTVVAVTGLTFKFAIGICTHTSVCTVFMRTIVTVVGLGNLAFS